MNRSSTDINETLYDEFWQSCPDFSRYNPGVLHRRRAILKRLQKFRFDTLLDVGCGDGELIAWLGSRLPPGTQFTGADLSGETVARNRERLPHAAFEVLNIEKQRLERRFGAIVCTEVLEHLDDQPTALGHLFAMLEPGARLVLTCPSGKVHATERHFGHVAHPAPEALRRMCLEVGFEVVSLENWGFPLYVGLKYLTNINTEWALRNFGTGRYDAKARFISKAVYFANFLNLPTTAYGCQQFLVAQRPG